MSYKSAKTDLMNYSKSSAWEGAAARRITDVNLKTLVAAMNDPDAGVKILALRLLISLGDSSAVTAITNELLNDASTNMPVMESDENEEPVSVADAANETLSALIAKKRN